MFEFQDDYQLERANGYANFITNKMHAINPEYDFEAGTDRDVFKSNTHNVVDLDSFTTTVVRKDGIDLFKHAESTNISGPKFEVMINLRNKSHRPIKYEKINAVLLAEANELTNADVRDFHQDVFIHFRDFSAKYKRNEMVLDLKSKELKSWLRWSN